MGLIRLRDEDIRLARDDRHACTLLDCDWLGRDKATALVFILRRRAKDMGLLLTNKADFGTSLSRMSTTYYKEIRLGTGYAEKSDADKAVTLAHELVHARQWRHFGPGTFRAKYLFATRWRWAVEVQAYRESVRALVALGAKPETVDAYIADRPRVLWEKYGIKSLRKADVYEHTIRLLVEAHVEAVGRRAKPPRAM